MNRKIVTGLLLILFLTSTVNAFNATSAFCYTANSLKVENTAGDLLKNVNSARTTKDSINFANTGYSDFLNFSRKNQASTQSSSWSSNSTQIVVGLADTWWAYAKVQQFALAKDGNVVNKVSMGGRVEAVVVNVPSDSIASFVTEVKEEGLSTYVEPNSKYQAYMEPNDKYYNLQWAPNKIQADYAWNATTGSKTVLVAIVDTGIDYGHPDLAANYVPLGYNWISNNSDTMDDNGHGTHVAGIIGAVINNGIGIAGLAQVRIMAEKGLDAYGSGTDITVAEAIIDATDKGANIISMSLGGSSPSTLLHDAIKYAYKHGVLLVAAAGNSGTSEKSYPAAYDEVIAVTATDQSDSLAFFSSYGDWVELAAPGFQIYSTTPTYYVTLNSEGVAENYDYLSGTSMACPQVSGVAALVWSKLPSMSRDILRLRLRYTADDLGKPGFDIYYGYGRVNARTAMEQPLPSHDIIIGSWEKPLYVEPGSTGIINATVSNYGANNETNVAVELLVNGSIVGQPSFFNMTSGDSIITSFSWTPTQKGNYNVTVYALPVAGEINTANNIIQGYVYVDVPLRVFVLRSAGTQLVTDAWDVLNNNWQSYGNKLIQIDYTTLDKSNITYADLNATKADVLILSCAYDPVWEYSDAEIAAITQYIYEGHGFIATAGTFYYQVPNNNKFAPLFGINESTFYDATETDLLNFLEPSHPLFAGIPNPYTVPTTATALPEDGVWSSNELAGGTYVAMGYYNESAIITYRGLVYISPWLESIPERYKFNLQLLYNAITWSRYQRPEHELATTLQVPPYMFPNNTITINATVTNYGLQNESNVDFQLSVKDITHNGTKLLLDQPIPSLLSSESYTMRYIWNPTVEAVYNITAYAPPVAGETDLTDNTATVLVNVAQPLIHPQEGTWASYRIEMNITGETPMHETLLLNYSKYISPYLMNVTLAESVSQYPYNITLTEWTTVNIFNRFCQGGVWQNYWFPGMVETNITTGSSVNVLNEPANVTGSEAIVFDKRISDCWKLLQNYPYSGNYTWWYDKTNGLWIKLNEAFSFGGGTTYSAVIMLENTSIPTGQQLAHELQVTLKVPDFAWLGNYSMLNATVLNLGTNNETNVQLILTFNGTIVLTLSVPELTVNNFSTISYLWRPTANGVFNVTAFAPPVNGEITTSNNKVTAWVEVQVLRGRVLFDQTHWSNSIGLYSTWISNLRAEGFIVDTHNTGEINSSVLAGYNALVIIGPYLDYNLYEIDAIGKFVANGGGLLVGSSGGSTAIFTSLTYFADIYWASGGGPWGYTNYIHPYAVTEGVHSVYLDTTSAKLLVSSKAQWLVNDTVSEIMLAVGWYKQGRIMGFSFEGGLRDQSIGLNGTDNLRLAINMIYWLCEKDTTPPLITSITPANGTFIRTTSVELEWNATDLQSAIDHYSVYRNGQWVANTTAQSYLLSGMSEGSNNVTLVAYDVAGNYASKSVMIMMDTISPEITSVTPINGTILRTTSVELEWNATDLQSGIDYYSVYRNNQFVVNTSAQSYHVSGLLEGANNVTLVAYDVAGNSANKLVVVIVDTTPPTVQILNPANNSYVRQAVAINVSGFDLHFGYMSVSIDGQLAASFDSNGEHTYSWNTLADAYGVYRITLVGYDSVGNTANVSIWVTVDNVSPTANILSPINATYVRGNITIAFIAQDLTLKNASITVEGIYTYDVTGENSIPFNTAILTDGTYMVKLDVCDLAGNKVETSITVAVDNTVPDARITNLSEGTFVKGSVGINVSYDDTNFNEAVLSIDGETVARVIDNHPFGQTLNTTQIINPFYTWDTTKVTDGIHTVILTVSDCAGNTKTLERRVMIDNTLPIGEIGSPLNSTYIKGSVIVTIYSHDANLSNMSLSISGGSILQTWNTSGTHGYSWNTTTVTDGLRTITLSIYDKAGNQFITSIKVNVDNTPPTVSILSPQNGNTVSGTVGINYTANDANSFNLTLFIDNSKIVVNPHQAYEWDTTKVVDGNHTIAIVATDIAGNIKTQTITLTTANAAPAYLTLVGYASAAVLGLALGALAVWAALRRKPVLPPTPAA